MNLSLFDNNEYLTKKEAIDFLGISEKEFKNYTKNSKEIVEKKIKNRLYFFNQDLLDWKTLKDSRTIVLDIEEYKRCFKFAIQMAYSSNSSHGTGIRGARSEVQQSDDFILGILAEYAVQKFLKKKFQIEINLDTEVHSTYITPQDFVGIKCGKGMRSCKVNVAIKSSKFKSCFNVIDPLEYTNKNRKSDYYIFARVGLPSDHLFRIIRNHSFFKEVKTLLDNTSGFRKIESLDKIPVWICGYNKWSDFRKVKSIPGQKFNNDRYVVSVSEMKNKDSDWIKLIKKM